MVTHKYTVEDWADYYADQWDEKTRLEMTDHLADCSECLGDYITCVEANISSAPARLKKDLMKKINNPLGPKKVMMAYVAAACIATGFYSAGWLDKTLAYAPQGIEKSFEAVDAVAENVNNITNKIIWRNLDEKEK